MPVEGTLPQLGESTFEGTIGKWLKQPGDRVERFEPLVEIITDKVNVEMPAPFGGILKEILVPEGETKNVGTPIAIMEVEEGAGVGVAPAAERHSAVATPNPAAASASTVPTGPPPPPPPPPRPHPLPPPRPESRPPRQSPRRLRRRERPPRGSRRSCGGWRR